MPHRAFIGLGTNLGDRAANYREAVQRLAALPTTRVVRQSSIYETEPVGDIKGAFINGVVEVETELAPDALMRRLLGTERLMGRKRVRGKKPATSRAKDRPRIIDLALIVLCNSTLVQMASRALSNAACVRQAARKVGMANMSASILRW